MAIHLSQSRAIPLLPFSSSALGAILQLDLVVVDVLLPADALHDVTDELELGAHAVVATQLLELLDEVREFHIGHEDVRPLRVLVDEAP